MKSWSCNLQFSHISYNNFQPKNSWQNAMSQIVFSNFLAAMITYKTRVREKWVSWPAWIKTMPYLSSRSSKMHIIIEERSSAYLVWCGRLNGSCPWLTHEIKYGVKYDNDDVDASYPILQFKNLTLRIYNCTHMKYIASFKNRI